MGTSTLEYPNPARLCVRPLQEQAKEPDTAEAELIQRLKAGDETTFREIVDRFGPKIYRVAVNECYGYLRKKRGRPASESDFADGTLSMRMKMMPDRQPTADHVLIQRDFVNKLLERIPEDERMLLIWKEVEGFSVSELSQMTGLRENTIKVRLFRARHRLVRAAAQLRGRKPSVR